MNPALMLLMRAMRAASAPAGLTFLNTYTTDANSTGFTFTGVDIGAEASNRTIIVAVYDERKAVTGVTIGGVTATLDVASVPGTANNAGLAFAHATVPSGTTASVVVTSAALALNHALAVWRIDGALTLTDSDSIQYSSNGAMGLTLTTAAGGIILAAACGHRGGCTATWTGVTETFDFTAIGAENGHFTAGSAVTTGADVTVTPAFTPTYAPTHVAVTYAIGA